MAVPSTTSSSTNNNNENNNPYRHQGSKKRNNRKSRKQREQEALWVPFLGAFALVLCWILYQVTFGKTSLQVDAAPEPPLVTVDRLGRFIDAGTSYITRVCHSPSQDVAERVGKFTYIAYLKDDLGKDYNFFEDDQDDYNLLRHNGAIYSLAKSYHRQPSTEVLEVMQRSVAWLKDAAIGPVPDMETPATDDEESSVTYIPELLAAWEDGTILGGGSTMKPTAKLGGAGLALIALCGLEEIAPGTTTLQELRQLGNFIHYLQNSEDGSFTCRYKPHKGGKDTSFVSLYYPGEAALGLISLAELEDEESLFKQRWITVATKALLYLETLRRNQELDEVEPDHWALLATARLLPLLDESTSDYWHVYQHAVKVMTSMVSVVGSYEELLQSNGCHTQDGRTCPTSTRLEGLLAGLTFLKEDELFLQESGEKAITLKERVLFFVEHGADFVLRSMEESSVHPSMHGAVPVRFHPGDEEGSKHRDQEVRIDYVQHSISAMMAYEQMLLHEGPYESWQTRKEKLRKGASFVKKRVVETIRHPGEEQNQTALIWLVVIGIPVIGVMVVAGKLMMRTATATLIKKSA